MVRPSIRHNPAHEGNLSLNVTGPYWAARKFHGDTNITFANRLDLYYRLHRAFVRVRWLFPNPLTPWISPSHRKLKRFESVDLVMSPLAFKVEGEAVVTRLWVECDPAYRDGEREHAYIVAR